jgi:hypothetical protein
MGLFLIYSANRREMTICDSIPTKFLVMTLLRGDSVYLDRYLGHHDMNLETTLRPPPWAVPVRGRHVSIYPVAPAVVAAPFAAPFVAYFDWRHPGWDRGTGYTYRFAFIAKTSASAIAALLGVVLLHLLRGLELGRMALPATVATMLGSDLWVTASQTLWQHGPVALALTTALWLLLPRRPAPWRLMLAGLAAAAMVACRPTAAVFAAATTAGVAWRRPRDLVPFLAAAAPVALALASYNLHFFGSLAGGYGRVGSAYVSSTPIAGMLGTLLSPNRGLFVFSPWVALALLTLPAAASRLRFHPVVVTALTAIPLHLAVISVFSCWWGGHSFGPRYWTEAMPLFGVMLGFGLQWSWSRCRPVFWAFLGSIAFSVIVQAIGAACYPSSWNSAAPGGPASDPAWMWSSRDTELSRCLAEGAHSRMW